MWSQQGNKLIVSDAIGSARFGISVDLSADGNTFIVGGHTDNANAGAAWIFIRSGNSWISQTKLIGSGAIGSARFGRSVSISSDGNTAIVGGYEDDASKGAVWVYTRSGSTWTQQGNKLVGNGANGNASQGFSISLSGDGNTALVGGIDDNAFAGAAWVFTRNGGVWSQSGNKLIGSDAIGSANQGGAVAISPDGNTVIVGGIADNTNKGAAWVFVPGTTAVEHISSEIPMEFMLEQNYPNPFNPSTNIKFQILEEGFVSLKIYDILGNEVTILVNEVKSPGVYEVKFDASRFSSGVYFYRIAIHSDKLSTNNFASVKKMILQK
ncbi:MAG: T9SS type A sorting domain-containing protein [Ignavibacteriaceae bacterium]